MYLSYFNFLKGSITPEPLFLCTSKEELENGLLKSTYLNFQPKVSPFECKESGVERELTYLSDYLSNS